MTTLNQICKNINRAKKKYKNRRLSLQKCPQKKGTCLKMLLITPRKPNSAIRKVARVTLNRKAKHGKFKRISAYIPGKGHSLQRFSNVLVRGGRVKDVPGMKYTLIRGVYDLKPVETRRQARSKYGAKLTRWRADHRYLKKKYW